MPRTPADFDVFDAHAHFFSHRFFTALLRAARSGGEVRDQDVAAAVGGLGLEPPPLDPLELAARWVGELDRHGVKQTVLIASVPADGPSVAAAVDAYPDRFTGYLMVDPRAPAAAENVERALDGGQFRGVCLFPAMHRFHVHDAAARQVIEVARKRRAVVFCHFGVLSVPIRDKLGVPNDFDGTYAVPTDLHRVAADFPDVTFQVPHFGGGYLAETLLLGAQRPNVVVDTSSSNGWMRLLPYPIDLETVVSKALDVFGPERLLWGSDSSVLPRGWRRDLFDRQLEAFEKAGCDDQALRAIFGGNARRLL
ncbi:MAG: amidohydrolase family protein [Planctomycetota bacterium]|nr:amidohydrolase family protein [Planctomycetota bacterium]